MHQRDNVLTSRNLEIRQMDQLFQSQIISETRLAIQLINS